MLEKFMKKSVLSYSFVQGTISWKLSIFGKISWKVTSQEREINLKLTYNYDVHRHGSQKDFPTRVNYNKQLYHIWCRDIQ